MEPITRKEVFLNAMCADKPCGLEPVSREEILLKRLVEAEANEGGGSGLPAGAKPNQYIVTDGEGNAKWEDKLCGSETSVSVIYSNPEITITNDDLNAREFGVFFDMDGFDMIPLVIGKKYIVVYNGVEYDCTAFAVADEVGIGNPNVASHKLDDNGVPFAVRTALPNQGGSRGIFFRDGVGTYSIEISAVEETITKISGKYVEGMGWSETVVLLKESDAAAYEHPSFGKAWLIENAPKLTVGETYTVTYNGNDYNCVCQSAPSGLSEDANAVAMGNFSVAGGQDTGDPFAMMISTEFNRVDIIDLSGASAVKVEIVGEAVHPIDKKYISAPVVFHWDDYESILTDASGNVVSYEEAKAAGRNVVIKYDGYECVPASIKCTDNSVFYNIYAASGWKMPSAGQGPV